MQEEGLNGGGRALVVAVLCYAAVLAVLFAPSLFGGKVLTQPP